MLQLFSFSLYAQISLGQKAFEEGIRLNERGRPLEAERQFVRALEFDPGNADIHFELANAYAARFDKWKHKPNHPTALGWLEKASSSFEQVIMIRPDYLAAHYNLGVIYTKRMEYEKARAQFQKVLSLDSRSVAAWMQIGKIYEEQGFFDEAEDAYLKAREFDYTNPEIRSVLEDLKLNRADYAKRAAARDAASSLEKYRRGFRYAAFSPASDYARDRRNAIENAQGPLAAIPYAAAMIIEEFMNRKAAKQVDD